MQRGQLISETFGKLDQVGSTGYYTTQECAAALDEAQDLFVLLTLCLETTKPFTLTAGTVFYHMLALFPDWIVPLRIHLADKSHLKPGRLEDLDALNSNWLASAGTPKRYIAIGFDLLGVWQQPAADTPAQITYARAPLPLSLDTDVPEIQEQFHPLLSDYAVSALREREGADQFQKTLPYLGRFFEGAQKHATFIRARNLASRYDKVPFELANADLSRLLKFRADVMPRRAQEQVNG